MEITRIDSDTILIDGVIFTKSELSGEYFTTSANATPKHISAVKLFSQGEIEDNMKPYQESLRGIIINLN